MKNTILVWVLALGVILTTPALAQSNNGVSPGVPDPRILSLQTKADELFSDGDVSRAFFIYRNELAPLGDKFAQYMVGYMHLAGLAVDKDRVAASAWYRLAAERGTPEFVQLRDKLLFELDDKERVRSDEIYRELRRQYHDLAVLLASIKRYEQALRGRSADGPASAPDSTSAFSPEPNSHGGAEYYEALERELEKQLRMLARFGNFPDLETDPDEIDIQEIERLVTARIDGLAY